MDPADAPASRPSRSRRGLFGVLAALVVELGIGATLVAAIVALLTTEPGLRTAVALVQRLAPVTIECDGVSGALNRDFAIDRLRLVAGRTTVEIERLRARIGAVTLLTPALDFDLLRADRVRVTVASADAPAAVPASIAAPLELKASRLVLGLLELKVGATTTLALRSIDGEAAIGREGSRIDHGRFEFAGMPVTLDGRLAAAPPFAIDARGTLGTALADRSVQAAWQASGNLVDLVVAADLQGGGVRGRATARIATFAPQPLQSLAADIDGIDPRAWNSAWPTARLKLHAQLHPDASATALIGPVQLVNHDPGTIDAGKLPVRAASARIMLARGALVADGLQALLSRGAANGTLALQWHGAPSAEARLRLDGVDPAAIHGAARSLAIDGQASVRYASGSTTLEADLHHRGTPALDARLALRVDSRLIQISAADLVLGEGRIALRGAVGLTGERRVALDGTVERLNPALLVKGIDARLNGALHIDARLAPQAQGHLQVELRDSQAFGRPLAGHGELRLDSSRQLDVDVALALRSARLSAVGGLGGTGRSLKLTLDAPALGELLPALRGGLKLDATAQGAWDAPAIDAHLTAQDLRAGMQRLRAAQVQLSYAGGTDGRIEARADLTDHRIEDHAALSLHDATLSVVGVASAHQIDVRATTLPGRHLVLAAEGGWADRRWRGTVRSASLDGPAALQLTAAAPLTFDTQGLDLGPLALDAAGARFDAMRLSLAGPMLRSEGRFTGLRPQPLVAFVFGQGGNGAVRSGEPLTLRGEWQLAVGRQADGRLLVERSGGDLQASGDPAAGGIGLRELRLQATLDANRLDARARAASERGGDIDARLAAFVERDEAAGWRLAPQRPWQIDANAAVPSLGQWQAAFADLIGRAVRVDGSLAARLRIDGTPAAMRADGQVSGEDLRLAWIEQGTRLDNGTLAAHLAGDTLIVDRLRFAATPRGKPRDDRVAARVDLGAKGSIEASGRIGLRDARGEIRVEARRLPVLQRPDRWVIASGSAAIAAARDGARLEGDVAVDAGYVEVSRSALPTLSEDVVVRRGGAAAELAPARYPFGFDLGISLGPAFRVRASGLDARAEGTIRLRRNATAGSSLVASGTIQTDDGRYDGFGQRLLIRRGRLNFQGAPENPGLDVLAVREGLPVEAGVTVTRNVASPLVRLYSDPPMADPEILSWLLYGHAGDQTRADNVALLQAAASVLGGGDEGITSRLARSLGLDDVSLRSGELRSATSLLPQTAVAGDLRAERSTTPGAATGIVSIGKRIGEAITISYEQAVSGTESAVQLTYRLSQRLYLVARAGTASAFELVYSWAFD